MAEPSALLRRITELEQRIGEMEERERRSAAKAWNARHQAIFNSMLFEDVVFPMLLQIGGLPHKANILNALQVIIERLPDHPGIPGPVQRYYDADVRGWQNAAAAIPEWQPLQYEDRRPDDFDDD